MIAVFESKTQINATMHAVWYPDVREIPSARMADHNSSCCTKKTCPFFTDMLIRFWYHD